MCKDELSLHFDVLLPLNYPYWGMSGYRSILIIYSCNQKYSTPHLKRH